MTSDCIFCKIVAGDVPADKVLETEDVLAFRDISPSAPTHVLLIPKKHVESMATLQVEDASLLGQLLLAACDVARQEGIAESGYRLVTNIGKDGGQAVFHIHFHLLGGRKLTWPPG